MEDNDDYKKISDKNNNHEIANNKIITIKQ